MKRFKIPVAILSFIILLSALFGCGTEANLFPDDNLEAAIRDAINKPQDSINTSDIEALTAFEAWGYDISDITGLEYCVNLKELYLDSKGISDISTLANLTNLEML